jgi:uncharacterized protein YacL
VLWSTPISAVLIIIYLCVGHLSSLIAIAIASRVVDTQQKALFGGSFCIIFTLFMGQIGRRIHHTKRREFCMISIRSVTD